MYIMEYLTPMVCMDIPGGTFFDYPGEISISTMMLGVTNQLTRIQEQNKILSNCPFSDHM